MLLPYEEYKKTVQAGLRSGFEIKFVDNPNYSYPRLYVDKEAKVVTVYNQHPKNVESLKALVANQEKYEREGRIIRVFEARPTPKDLFKLGLTPCRLGAVSFQEFISKMYAGTLTNQYLKSLMNP